MTEPVFGMTILADDTEPVVVAGSDMSVIGLVVIAQDADVAAFPLNTPVLMYSNDAVALAKLGATGTAADAINGINDQLVEFQAAAKMVIVRGEEALDEHDAPDVQTTIANLVTAVQALSQAPAVLGVTPRLVAVPGYTYQPAGQNGANAVCASLPAVLNSLLAVAVVEGPNTSAADDKAWRESLDDKRLIPVTGGWTVLKGAPAVATAVPLAPRILGLAVAVDHANAGRPFKSWANRAIAGGLGPARNIPFSLTDGAVEGQDLLAHQIGVVVRGEDGVDTAISDAGFVFIGFENASPDPLWTQYHQVRGRDWIHLYFIRALRTYLGKFNLTQQTVQAVMNTMRTELRNRQTDGDILGFNVSFVPAQNDPLNLRAGKVKIQFQGEEAPVLRQITISSARYLTALDDLVAALAAQPTPVAA
jgi:hypothetical protein